MRFSQTNSKGFNFGIDKAAIADQLRCLATEIDAGRILPQAISHKISNQTDDFEFTTLELTYAEPAQV